MDVITLVAQTRKTGKGPARAARRAGEVPCVLYGNNVEPVVFQVPEPSLRNLIFTSEMHRVEVQIGKKSWDCVVKQIDFHPLGDQPIHVDFQVLNKDEVITLMIPIRYLGTPLGQRDGGRIQAFAHEISVTCLPKHLPDHIDIDVSGLKIGDTVHVSDLAHESITFGTPAETLLYSVSAARVDVDETVAPEAAATEAEEGEE